MDKDYLDEEYYTWDQYSPKRKKSRNGRSRVGLCQALRRRGATYAEIATLLGISRRVAWSHVNTPRAEGCCTWEQRHYFAQSCLEQEAFYLLNPNSRPSR